MGCYEKAQREVELFKGKQNSDCSEYYLNVCESALRAFKVLCEDGHSGCSINITMDILNRMVKGLPLTPITEDDEWREQPIYMNETHKNYISSRMSGLFKKVEEDENGVECVSYNDVNRVECVDINNPDACFYSGLVNSLFNKMHPITLPYNPSTKSIRVFCEDFLYDKRNGDFDTVGVFYALYPDGHIENINKFYYLDSENGKEEISREKYNEMKENRCDR